MLSFIYMQEIWIPIQETGRFSLVERLPDNLGQLACDTYGKCLSVGAIVVSLGEVQLQKYMQMLYINSDCWSDLSFMLYVYTLICCYLVCFQGWPYINGPWRNRELLCLRVFSSITCCPSRNHYCYRYAVYFIKKIKVLLLDVNK